MDKKRIKELLKKCKGNRTGKEFAAQVGISEAHMSKILSVKNIPKPSTIEKIIEASPNSGISLNELLTAFEYSAIIQEYSSFEKELNMFPVLWNIDPLDWCSHNAECIAAKVVENAGDGDIILMHDYYDTSVTAALEVVDVLQKRGFQFVTVKEILFD